jgi:hypothetical protein
MYRVVHNEGIYNMTWRWIYVLTFLWITTIITSCFIGNVLSICFFTPGKKREHISRERIYVMLRVPTSIVILIFFVISCTSTSVKVYKNSQLNLYQSTRVAILPFEDAAAQVGSGEIVASIFETTLLSKGKFEIVERRQLDKILDEQKLSSSGLVEDPVSVGRLVKADVVVVGMVTTWHKAGWGGSPGTTVGASIKGINVEKGIILWSIDKTSTAQFWTDGLPTNSSCDVVAKKLCREMVNALFK